MRRHAATAAGLLALTALGLWLRWPGLFNEGFHNEDAAGITYNADLLRNGLVPLVDSHELKAPGSFFLTWAVWEVAGRSIQALQQAAAVFALLAALGVGVGARLLSGSRLAAWVAGTLYLVCSPITDSIDINYIAWMITPYIWAAVAAVQALRSGRLRWWFVAGVLVGVAALMKHQAGLVFPLFLWLVLVRHRRPEGWAPPVDRGRGFLALGFGLAAGFLTVGFYYLAVGEPGAFIRTFFFSQGGWKYAAQTEIGLSDKLVRLWDGVVGFTRFMAVPTLLAVVGVLLAPRRGMTVRGVFLIGHFLCSLAGLAIGFRFFKGYYLQMLPVALWLATLPWGPVLRWLDPAARGLENLRFWLVAALVAVPLVPAARVDLKELNLIRETRRRPVDLDVQRIGRIIRENTTPTDTIWVWGRWGWPAYFHADRRAATTHYKVMGVLTTNLTNTWRRATLPTRFVHGEAEAALMADLRRNRPTFIVVSHNEDYKDFKSFRDLLRTEYRPSPGFTTRRFNLYVRKDHPMKARAPARKVPPRPAPRPLPGLKGPGSVAPGLKAPGSAAPGSAAPGSAAPGSTAPGSTAPGSTAPGSAGSPAPR